MGLAANPSSAGYTGRMTDGSIAFIGGGNMARALIGGLIQSGRAASDLIVIEPAAAARAQLQQAFGVSARAAAEPDLARATLVVWAVKPQLFAQAAAPCAPWIAGALQLSVMAGVRSDAIVHASGSEQVVRAMPNTPALIGQGIAGLFARAAVSAAQRASVESILAPTGRTLWVPREEDLDAVTALSGSGPAYVFLFLEAMISVAQRMGLSAEQGRELALATFAGATALAAQSDATPAELRAQVTSKGGTTYAALQSLAADGVPEAIARAVLAAQARAAELGDEFGAGPR